MDIEVEYDPDNLTDELLTLYRTYDWWADRTEEDLKHALRHTDEMVILRDHDTEIIVAAARILTDYIYYAKIYDVIVSEEYRSNGIGRQLMEAITDHPKLAETRGLELLCREGLVPFYQSCGFEINDQNIEHPDGSPEPLRSMKYQYK
jgi:predicted GNAT family N-acyltransferase